ncbi:MAG: GNAT family N-acetyltransferase [Polyangiaceae bacterium]|nr:GNAT family N-acetyltransferase [Polyangiaceae bacterium]
MFESCATERLLLRRPNPADALAIFDSYAADPEVTRFLIWLRHQRIADTLAFIEFADEVWTSTGIGPLLIVRAADGAVLGSTGIDLDGPGRASIGYVLARAAWGKGYATETLGAVVDLGRRAGLSELHAWVHPENPASIRVLEKCGFARQPGYPRTEVFPNLGTPVPVPLFEYTRELQPP